MEKAPKQLEDQFCENDGEVEGDAREQRSSISNLWYMMISLLICF